MEPGGVAAEAGTAMSALGALVERVFGFGTLRPLQADAMQAALEGRDALVVLATGGGKSLCYQAPALLREGVTAVVSPLISLMKDQTDGLVGNGVPAVMLTSAQDPPERRRVRSELAAGRCKLLFVAPERLLLPGFLEELVDLGLSGLVIDEAHCISHWGHDFRPEYRQIGQVRRLHPDLPIQAFTATATPKVQADIVAQLALRDPLVLIGSCDRPNLTYRFLPRADARAQVLEVIHRHPRQAGIVYCLRRRDVDQLAADLARAGVTCLPYHAGLEAEERKRNQERFLREEVQVMVATVAFGMGIDRADVRFVVHASLPKGLEQYSQESGRAGRDGLPAECVLLHSGSDYHGWRSMLERAAAEPVEAGEEPAGGDLQGSIERLGRMYAFATGALCRHRFLVEHFGQSFVPAHGADAGKGCGACDVCLGELQAIDGGTLLAQKVLSCVVRCEQRYGAAHVADVLRGASTERVRRTGHDGLSTFGLLREHSAREIRHWIEQLVGMGLLRVTGEEYPTLRLAQGGVEVLKGEREVTLFALPAPRRRSRARSLAELASDPRAAPADAGLFEHLRSLRRRLAAERGVPPYLIFNDATLAALASARPTALAELGSIKGIGERKSADLGPTFLAAIAAWQSSSPAG